MSWHSRCAGAGSASGSVSSSACWPRRSCFSAALRSWFAEWKRRPDAAFPVANFLRSAFGERRFALLLADQVHEPPEEIVAVLRARRGFRVVLHREDRLAGDAQAAIGAVEERDVGFLDAPGQRFRIHRET